MKGLEDLLVLDFSRLLPGPFATMVLADLGCRVVKVELPRWSDWVRSIPPKIDGEGFAYFAANRNKQSLCVDPREPEGKRVLGALLKKADVLVEGFRPGLMEKLGLGYDRLKAAHPRLVYCSIGGYGDGPKSGKACHDLSVLAESGWLALGDSNGGTSFPPTQAADLSASLFAATAILAALLERHETGKGQRVRVSMADAALALLPLPAADFAATRKPAKPKSRWWNGTHPFYRLYKTKDRRFVAVAAVERVFATGLLRALGLERLEKRLDRVIAGGDPVLEGALAEAFAKRTLARWERDLADCDVCVSPVRTLAEALESPLYADWKKRYPHIPSPMRFEWEDLRVRRNPPRLGQDNAAIAREAGEAKART